jgi:hypothetical protein
LKYHVTCSRPGMNRGGRSNPAQAPYEQGDHTPAQLRELLADPHTHVLVGEPMTEAHIAAMEAEAEKPKPTAKPTKA